MKRIILNLILLINSLCNCAAIENETQVIINTNLFNAIRANDIETARQMITSGAKFNCMYYSRNNKLFGFEGYCTPLHKAVFQNNPQMVKLFLESGANVNIQAIVFGSKNLIFTPLHFAICDDPNLKIFYNNLDIINIAAGEKPIDRSKSRFEIIKLLLEYGAIVPENLISKIYDSPSYANIAKKVISGFISAIGLSGVDEPDINAKNLMQAVILDDRYAVKLFLTIGSNKEINAKDKFGFSALMWAFTRGNLDLAKIILEHCDNNNVNLEFANDEGENALQLAIKHKHNEIINLFRNFMISCMSKSVSEKLPRPLLNLICEYSDF